MKPDRDRLPRHPSGPLAIKRMAERAELELLTPEERVARMREMAEARKAERLSNKAARMAERASKRPPTLDNEGAQ